MGCIKDAPWLLARVGLYYGVSKPHPELNSKYPVPQLWPQYIAFAPEPVTEFSGIVIKASNFCGFGARAF